MPSWRPNIGMRAKLEEQRILYWAKDVMPVQGIATSINDEARSYIRIVAQGFSPSAFARKRWMKRRMRMRHALLRNPIFRRVRAVRTVLHVLFY